MHSIYQSFFFLQVNTPERFRKVVLPKEIQDLFNEVRVLREDTKSLVCNCNEPDCPFEESHLASLKEPAEIFSDSPRTRRTGFSSTVLSPTNSLKGIERRRDGTIVERDGPRSISSEDSLEKRLQKSQVNFLIGQHLSVSSTMLSDSEDCLVDNDNLFGTSSDDDLTFSRFEVSRKQIRRHTKSAKLSKRRVTMMYKSCSTLPGQMRKASMGLESQRFSQQLRNASSLPSCIFFETEEYCLSASSSSSSISNTEHAPSHTNFARQHNALIATR